MKYNNSWHLLRDSEVLNELATDMYTGLSSNEAKRRRHKYGTNNVWKVKKRSAWEIVSASLFDLPTLLLVISAAVAALFNKKYEAGAIAAILVISGIIRAVTYFRANRIFEDMAEEKIPVSSVIRDGTIRLIRANEIVPGDIIFLEIGDTVPCDGRVISGDDATVSERGITENKTAVHKFNTVIQTKSQSGEIPCEFRSNMVFAGSKVLSGSLRMAAVACGNNTLIGMQRGGIEIHPSDSVPLVEKLRGRSKTTSLIMLGCVLVVTILSLFVGEHTLSEVFLCTMAMAVAAMSEFLTGIGYIIVAITLRDAADGKTDGVVQIHNIPIEDRKKNRKSASRIIIKEPEKLETIATPDVAVFCGVQYFKSGKAELYAYHADGKFYSNDDINESGVGETKPLSELLTLASAATAVNANGISSDGESRRTAEDSTLVGRANDAYLRKTGDMIKPDFSIYDHCSAGERRAVGIDASVIYRKEQTILVVCGSVEDVMRSASHIVSENGIRPITPEDKRQIFTECATLEFGGARVLAVGEKKASDFVIDPLSVRSGMTFVGFFAVAQEPEAETNSQLKANIEFLKNAGIVPVLFTERADNDLYYCHRFGLFNKKTVRVNASDLATVNFDALGSDGLIVSFADLGGVYLTSAYDACIKLLKGITTENPEGERTVVTLGMEIWDCGALKSSDIGIAVARSDYQSVPQLLSRQAAVAVYPENGKTENGYGGFSGFVRGIKYARRAIENIDSAKIYITASQCARLLIIILALFTPIPIMSSVFILIWGLLFDFVTSLVMAFENNGRQDGYIRKRFEKNDDGYDESEKKAEAEKKTTRFSIILGIIWGIVTVTVLIPVMLLSQVMNYTYSPELAAAVISASILLSGMVLALEIMKRSSIFVSHNPNGAQLVYIIVTVILALLILFTGFGSKLAGGTATAFASVFSLIPPAIVVLGCEIAKIIEKRKEKKSEE